MKDIWDKIEIGAKVAGAIVIPLAIAGSALYWNHKQAERQSAEQYFEIAIGILENSSDSAKTAELVAWAERTIENPAEPVQLTAKAVQGFRELNSQLPIIPAELLEPCQRPLVLNKEGWMSDRDVTQAWGTDRLNLVHCANSFDILVRLITQQKTESN